MKKLNWRNGIIIFILVFTGSMLRTIINLSASLIFWGTVACLLALYSVKNPCWDLKEEYKSLDVAIRRNKITTVCAFLMGLSCFVTAVILHFDSGIHWGMLLVVVVVILLIPMLHFDNKLWPQIPPEDRPWMYRKD